MTFIPTLNGTPLAGDGFNTKAEARMYVNRNNGAKARRGDESKPYGFFEGEIVVTYEWHREGGRKDLVRTRTVLRNVGPASQEVVSTSAREVYETDRDWAKGVAWADEVEAEDDMAANHPWA